MTETTTARSDTSEDGETVEHTTRVETVTQLDVPHQEMPHNCPPSSLECDLQDGLSTPPPPSPTRTDSSSSSRKRNNPSSAEEPQVDQVTKSDEEKDSPSAPASASRKKCRIILPTSSSRGEGTASAEETDYPRLGNTLPSENAASPETATASPGPTPDNVLTSNEPSTPTCADASTAASRKHAPSAPKRATTSPLRP